MRQLSVSGVAPSASLLASSLSVIAFDEFFNYKGYELHEYRAFFEFLERFGVACRFIGYAGQQVSLIVEAVQRPRG